MIKLNEKMEAGTDAATVTDVQVTSSSQTIAKPIVICRFLTYGGKLIDFVGDPIYYKVNGIYGYLCLCGRKIVHFYSDADGQLFYDEPNGWSVLNGI